MAGPVPALLQDLAVITAVAGAATLLFHRLRQPVILGYLLAGFIVGPHTPPFPFVGDIEVVNVLGEIGVVFLLFALGLEFNLGKLRKVGVTALVSGTLQVALMIWLGYTVGRAFGLEPVGAIFLGGIVSISSTVIIVKTVSELGQKDEEWAEIVFGILIVEDILAVLMLTLLAAVGSAAAPEPATVALLLGQFTLFIGAALVLGLLLVPRLIDYVARINLPDVLVVTSIGLGLGLALLGGKLGFSPALGAFVMGALIAESKSHHIVEERIVPIRDLFTAIFFVTVGMLVDPRLILEHWALILAVTVAVIVGKILAGSFATFVGGRDPATALRVGFGLAQVGEFSFIIAALAVSLRVTDAPLYTVAVSVATITAFTTPYLIARAPGAVRLLDRLAPRPLRTYSALYGAWTRRLREAGATPARRRAARAGVESVLLAAATVAIIIGGAVSVRVVGDVLLRATGLQLAAAVLGWAATGLLAIPPLVLYVRAQRRFVEALAEAAFPSRAGTASADVGAVRRVLSNTFLLASLVMGSAFLLVFTSPLLPTGPIVALVLVVLIVSATVLYRSLARFQARFDEVLRIALGDSTDTTTSQRPESQRALLGILRDTDAWDLDVREVEVPALPVAGGLTPARLSLRARTGASLVAIRRGGEQIVNPRPDMPLLPTDRLLLMGEPEQLERAEALLHEAPPAASDEEPALARELEVEPDSALAGRTLARLRWREQTGATVLAVRRHGERLPNPGPETQLLAGDTLLLLATERQYDRARALARTPPDDPHGAG